MKNKLKKSKIFYSFRKNRISFQKKAALALPWEKIIWWAILFLFALFMLWFYGGLREMVMNIMKSVFK